MIEQLLFLYFGAVTLAGALFAILSRNLIYSALSLLVTFLHIGGIYILMNAEFIAAVQIIVYAGAILVLYLFVLMLFNPDEERRPLYKQAYIGVIAGLILFGITSLAVFRSHLSGQQGDFVAHSSGAGMTNTQALGQALFTDFVFPFEVASLILLVAMLGAIVLAGRRGKKKKRVRPVVDIVAE